MTKKDYEKFARLLRKLAPDPTNFDRANELLIKQHTRIVTGIVGVFREDNHNFDVSQFINAITKGD
jgi:hypothetical protein